MKVIKTQNIIIAWLAWHFFQMPQFLFAVWGNYLAFILDYFSIPTLLLTLLAPWRNYRWKYPRGFAVGELLTVFISNIFSRVVGFICRLVLIATGIVTLAVVLIAGLVVIVIWIALPLCMVFIAFFTLLQGMYLPIKLIGLAVVAVWLTWETMTFFSYRLRRPVFLVRLPDIIAQISDYPIEAFLSRSSQRIFARAIHSCRRRKLSPMPSETLFLALIEGSQEVCSILYRLGIDHKKLRTNLKNYLEKCPQEKTVVSKVSESWQKSLEKAALVAAERGKLQITEKELLVGLAYQDAFFQNLLVAQDLKEKDIENITLWLDALQVHQAKEKQFWTKENLAKYGSLGKDWAAGYTVTLDAFSIDWEKISARHAFGEIIGHEREISELEIALDTFSLRNALIVGEPGVGRKSLVQALAERCYFGTGLPNLKGKRVVELDMVQLLARTQGQEKVESLLDEILTEAEAAGNVILVIDELDHFVGDKVQKLGEVDISTILGKYLKMPHFQFVGITSQDGLHRNLEDNASFLEYFRKIEVAEISEMETIRVLQNIALQIEHRDNIMILYPSVREIVNLSARYFPSTPFPKKAVDILQEAAVYVKSLKEKVILPHHIAKIISDKTQIPVGKMEFKEKSVLLNLEKLIHEKIVNQAEAVSEISVAMRRARSGISNKKRPMGTFLFLGPTGVGKTETAKALADIYFGGQDKMIRLDMSEFQAIADIPRLLGAISPVEQQGLLTTPVRENPFALVLLDEIEKAHPDILNLLLQVLDEGHITDGQGRRVLFTNTIIICTSNAGAAAIFHATEAGKAINRDEFLSFLFDKGIFRPEFINRFDATVIFHPLSKENLMEIAQLTLAALAKNLQDKDVEFVISQPLKEKIVELSYKPEFGARQMRRVMQDKVENPIAEALLQEKLTKGDKFEINPENFEVVKLS